MRTGNRRKQSGVQTPDEVKTPVDDRSRSSRRHVVYKPELASVDNLSSDQKEIMDQCTLSLPKGWKDSFDIGRNNIRKMFAKDPYIYVKNLTQNYDVRSRLLSLCRLVYLGMYDKFVDLMRLDHRNIRYFPNFTPFEEGRRLQGSVFEGADDLDEFLAGTDTAYEDYLRRKKPSKAKKSHSSKVMVPSMQGKKSRELITYSEVEVSKKKSRSQRRKKKNRKMETPQLWLDEAETGNVMGKSSKISHKPAMDEKTHRKLYNEAKAKKGQKLADKRRARREKRVVSKEQDKDRSERKHKELDGEDVMRISAAHENRKRILEAKEFRRKRIAANTKTSRDRRRNRRKLNSRENRLERRKLEREEKTEKKVGGFLRKPTIFSRDDSAPRFARRFNARKDKKTKLKPKTTSRSRRRKRREKERELVTESLEEKSDDGYYNEWLSFDFDNKADEVILQEIGVQEEPGFSWLDIKEYLSPIVSFADLSEDMIEKACKWISSFALFGYQIYKSRDIGDYIASCLALCNSFGNPTHAMLNLVKDFSTLSYKWLSECLITESISGVVNTLQSVMTMIVNSHFLQALRNVFLGLISLKLFSHDWAKKAFNYLGKPVGRTFGDAIFSVLDGLSSLMRHSESLSEGFSMTEFFFKDDTVDSLLESGIYLERNRLRTYCGLPVEHCVDERTYMMRLNDFLASASDIAPSLNRLDHRRDVLIRLMEVLKDVHREKVIEIRGRDRSAPLGVMISGPPGMGKSHLTKYVCRLQSFSRGRSHQDGFVHSRCKTSTYMEGYDPVSNPILHYSEVGNMSAQVVQSQGDPILSEIQSLIDNLTFNVDRAFGDKGKVYAFPEMLIVDTNNPRCNVDTLMSCPSAFLRRFEIVDVSVKPEFRKDGTTSLDMAKSLESEDFILNRYLFTLYVYEPYDRTPIRKVIKANMELKEFTKLMLQRFRNHLIKQTTVLDRASGDNVQSYIDSIIDESSSEEDDYDEKYPINVEFTDSDSELNSEMHVEGYIAASNFLTNCKNKMLGYGDNMLNEFKLWFLAALLSWIQLDIGTIPRFKFRPRFAGELLIFLYLGFFKLALLFSPFIFINFAYVVCQLIQLVAPVNVNRLLIVVNNLNRRRLYLDSIMSNIRKPFNWFKNMDNNYLLLGATLTSLTCGYTLYKRYKKAYTESKTDFNFDHERNEALNDYEESSGCAQGVRRQKLKFHNAWNTVLGGDIPVHTNNSMSLWESIRKNVFKVRIDDDKGPGRITMMLGIRGNFALINTHALRHDKITQIGIYPSWDEVSDNTLRVYAIQEDLRYDLGNDLTIIRVDRMFRNITKHIATQTYEYARGLICGDRISISEAQQRMSDSVLGDINIDSYSYRYNNHYPGLCGMPILADVGKGSVIVGIHSAGSNSGICAASRVTLEVIMEGLNKLEEKFSFNLRSGKMLVTQTLMPNSKSSFCYENLQHLDYYGKLPGNIILAGKSNLTKSVIADDLDEFFFEKFNHIVEEFYCPPVMRPREYKGNYQSPYNNLLIKMNNTPPTLDYKTLRYVIDEFSERIILGLRERNVYTLSPLTLEQAINGVPGDDFTRRINMSTSAGYGYPGGKRSFFHEHIDEIYEMGDILKEDVDLFLQSCQEDEFIRTLNEMQLKDEARPISKVEKASTRGFCMTTIMKLIVSKQYLSPIYTRMIEFGDLFCTSVGINIHVEADKFVRELGEFSPNIIEGDYSGYDVANPIMIGYAASCVVHNVLGTLGYNEHAMNVVDSLLSDDLYPLTVLNKDLFCRSGYQPSGKYGTACDNSLRGVVMLMYAWYVNPQTRDHPFFENVLPRVYGDDLLASVKPRFSDSFNNLTYQEACDTHFNMKFTTASKSDDMSKYVTIETMSFLKRKFVYHENLERYVAQLSLDSIYKALYWFLPSSSEPPIQQLVHTIVSMMWEIFFYCVDEDEYEDKKLFLVDLLKDKLDLDITDKLPSYIYIASRVVPSDLDHLTEGVENLRCEKRDTEEEEYSKIPLSGFVPLFKDRQTGNSKDDLGCIAYDHFINRCSDIKYQNEEKTPQNKADLELAFRAELAVLKAEGPLLEDLDRHLRDPKLRIDRLQNKDLNALFQRTVRIRELEQSIKYLERHRSLFTESKLMESGEMSMKVVENLQLDGEIITSNEKVGISDNVSVGENTKLHLDEWFERPVEIAAFEIGDAQSFLLEYDIWDLWSLTPSVRAKLKNYSFLKCDLRAHIVVSASRFHAMQVLVSYMPYPVRNSNYQAKVAQAAIMQPALLNMFSTLDGAFTFMCSEDGDFELDIPFISYKATHRLFSNNDAVLSDASSYPDLRDAGSLLLASIGDLRVTQGTTGVRFRIYVTAHNVHLGPPTKTVIQLTTESRNVNKLLKKEKKDRRREDMLVEEDSFLYPQSDERKTGPIENVTTTATNILREVGDYPVIGKYAKASAEVLDGVGRGATELGWSKPVEVATPVYVKNEPFRNGAHAIDAETAKRLTWDPLQELSVDPRMGASLNDDMAFSTFCGKKTYLTSFTVLPSQNPGEVVWRSMVDPMLSTIINGTNTAVQPTPLAFVANFFQRWCGDIVFTFVPVVTPFDRVKVKVVAEPNISQSVLLSGGNELNKQYVGVFNTTEQVSFEYVVGWQSPRPWLRVRPINSVGNMYGDNYAITTTSHLFTNGYIELSLLTGLVNNDGSGVRFNVFVHGENMHFGYPTGSNLPGDRLFTESLNLGDCERIELNPTSRDYSESFLYNFGEEIVSFRMLCKRMVTSQTVGITAAGTDSYAKFQIRSIPRVLPTFSTNATFKHPIEQIRYCFLFLRGSIRYRFFLSNGTFNPSRLRFISVTLDAPSSTYSGDSGSWASTADPAVLQGTVRFMPHVNGGIEFEVPFYNNNLALFSCQDDNVSIEEDGGFDPLYTRSVTVVTAADSTQNALGTFDLSSGEDFTMFKFVGVPHSVF